MLCLSSSNSRLSQRPMGIRADYFERVSFQVFIIKNTGLKFQVDFRPAFILLREGQRVSDSAQHREQANRNHRQPQGADEKGQRKKHKSIFR